MTAIPIRELSHHTARALALVKAGETIDITERGRIIGRIVPVDRVQDMRARLAAEGRIRPATRGRADLLADLHRRGRSEAVDDASQVNAALQELRDGERY
ncbi:type II toxin-antitoxin system Phd/YefM family antitoxin [Nocardia aurantia]|uniref:type II toxin-antitoxin system Phd/YefM family antitoxin n=1 Tax=Nocardia aurantia TaxID=2585199 RepID=UPI0012977AD7|nr:prevent-host-death protein [Nocardia aurantia]